MGFQHRRHSLAFAAAFSLIATSSLASVLIAHSAPDNPSLTDTVNMLLPRPAAVKRGGCDTGFTLTADTVIFADTAAQSAGKELASVLRQSSGFPLPLVDSVPHGTNVIELRIAPIKAVPGVPDDTSDEAYVMKSCDGSVNITSPTSRGALWGAQTLIQAFGPWARMATPISATWTLPAVEIDDAPAYRWRGIELDPARSFIPVDEVKDIINTMSAYKMNVLHMHLSDDQGWRIEVPAQAEDSTDTINYSKLIKRSSKTSYMAGKSKFAPSAGRTGYYTHNEFVDLVKFATAKGVQIIPEIDGPGHTASILHALDEMNTPNSLPQPPAGETTIPPFDESSAFSTKLDEVAPVTFQFMRHVLTAVSDLTSDSGFIHIGGDESGRSTAAGYSNYMTNVTGIVGGLNKAPIVWNEALAKSSSSLPNDAVVQWWTGNPKTTTNAARLKDFTSRGGRLIASPVMNAYYPQRESSTLAGPSWACGGGACDLRTAYSWDPADFLGVNPSNILGLEGAEWSEHIRTDHDMQFIMFPRVLAHAEIGWTPKSQKDFADFTKRVAVAGTSLNVINITFNKGPLVRWKADAIGAALTDSSSDPLTTIGYVSAPGLAPADLTVTVSGVSVDDVSLTQEIAFRYTDANQTTGRQMGSVIAVKVPSITVKANSNFVISVGSSLGDVTAVSTVAPAAGSSQSPSATPSTTPSPSIPSAKPTTSDIYRAHPEFLPNTGIPGSSYSMLMLVIALGGVAVAVRFERRQR